MKINHLLIVFLLSTVCTFSQADADKLNDDALDIYKENPQKAIQILEEAIEISKSNKNQQQLSRSKNSLGIVYRDLGDFKKAKSLSEEALSITTDSLIRASAYNNIGASNRSLGMYEEALQFYLKALHIYETNNESSMLATVSNNIGMVYSYLNMNSKAIEYHLKAKDIFEDEKNLKGISEVYNNIAILYANDGELDKALEYFKYSLKIEEQLKDKKGIAESANNVGGVYYYMAQIDSSLIYFKRSASIEKSIGNLSGLGASYNNIAQVLMENNRVEESKTYLDSAYYYAKKTNTVVEIQSALNSYASYYEAKNNPAEALKYFKEYAAVKDSLLNIETNSKVAKLEIEYQTEKKEKEILSQRADLAEKELSLSKKNSYILGLITLAVVLILLGFLVYNQQKLKNRQLQKENELKDALLKIETQNRLQEQRLRISRDLHDNIGAQLTFIISSLDNLKYGFQLPEKLNDKLKTISDFASTTIYELRDTIWAMNKSEITFEDLQSRVSNFMDKANSSAEQIQFNFNVDTGLSNTLTFTSVEGMNIYRIIQEAINNALKYAQANTIDVQFKKVDSELLVSIIDDGKGFEPSTVEDGNGLNNMKKRAHDIDGQITIVSEATKGTTIQLHIQIKTYNTTNNV